MGMYTELFLTVDLKENTRKEIISWLYSMVDGRYDLTRTMELCPKEMKKTRFEGGLVRGSYHFYGQPFMVFEWDEVSKTYHLTLLTNLKNHNDEIDKLLSLLRPHIAMCDREMMGYTRHEEDAEPTILYFEKV